ncbi:DUF4245 domain-containing protein [Corynebacterium terpenotabidum]|uniref:DUF4245 domain-containing protein n=1 Tax=Corynebacterium terpenotabidum Y-11 TaxID=1200352 RepID=S4XDI1_9CORY|nr:DUF4245 domain-containing protein [Corynebacterium terpenotabidum]AGP31207.1 hypothetical protein A606_07810 [Corynebacterium terpenotabidum Y-11]
MIAVKFEKPRMFTGTRDIVISLAVLLVVVFFSVGFTGLCSFNPGPAERSGPVQEVDIETILQSDARGLGIPIRLPELSDSWQANSVRRTMVDNEPSSKAGWVIDEQVFLALTQTVAELKDAVDDEDGEYREETDTFVVPAAQSSTGEDVTWQIWSGDDVKEIWAVDLGDVRLLISGTATRSQYETLATAAVKAQPLEVAAASTEAADATA